MQYLWVKSRFLLLILGFLTAFFQPHDLSAQSKSGEKIYLQKCAKCHGKQGQGVKKVYPESLIGDLSIKELTKYIEETMPEEKPETCVGKEAAAVAAHIHHQFYSITAQARNKPARITFSRLTNRQYRNSVADLIGSFIWDREFEQQGGLKINVFKNKAWNEKNILIDRVESDINLSFDEEHKPDEKLEFKSFVVRWNGSLIAPETGLYDIVLVTENAGKVWVNDEQTPLIDVEVKSGDQTEYRKTIYLLGGRAHYFRTTIYKSKTEKKFSAQLKWKPPHQSEQLIPSRNFMPMKFPEMLVLETPFPPDDKSVGYERGISISQEWNDATTYAAVEVAEKVIAKIDRLAKLDENPKKQAPQLRQFCEKFAKRAFRKPLSAQLKKVYIDRQFERVDDPRIATKRVMMLVLKSPRFLYPGIFEEAKSKQAEQFRVAEWLALSLWDSIPDQQLWERAESGKLNTKAEIKSQAMRMVNNYRTQSKVREFFHQWLQYDHFYDLSKSKELYPEFDERLASDLRVSLDLLIDDIVWSEKSDFRELLSTNTIYMNKPMAKFYGVKLNHPEKAEFQKVAFDSEHRAGLISHPYLMAGLAYEQESSPIHRGVFLARSLMGRFLKPPPIAVAPLEVKLHPGMTTRERVALQTKGAVCGSCHGLINPLGFTLENYDAVGRFRVKEKGKKVNAVGVYIDRTGKEVPLNGARDLTKFLIKNPDTHAAFAEQLFQYLTKQPTQAFGEKTLPRLRESFEKNDSNIKKLLAEIVTQSAITNRELSRKK